MSLQEIREQLDDIDAQILALYERRMELCEQVGNDKLKTGKKVYDRKREEEKLAVLSEKASNERNKKGISICFPMGQDQGWIIEALFFCNGVI